MPGLPISKDITKKSSQEPSVLREGSSQQPLGSNLIEIEESKEALELEEIIRESILLDNFDELNQPDVEIALDGLVDQSDGDKIKVCELNGQTPLNLVNQYNSVDISNQLERLNTKREETDFFNEGNSPASSDATVV